MRNLVHQEQPDPLALPEQQVHKGQQVNKEQLEQMVLQEIKDRQVRQEV